MICLSAATSAVCDGVSAPFQPNIFVWKVPRVVEGEDVQRLVETDGHGHGAVSSGLRSLSGPPTERKHATAGLGVSAEAFRLDWISLARSTSTLVLSTVPPSPRIP